MSNLPEEDLVDVDVDVDVAIGGLLSIQIAKPPGIGDPTEVDSQHSS